MSEKKPVSVIKEGQLRKGGLNPRPDQIPPRPAEPRTVPAPPSQSQTQNVPQTPEPPPGAQKGKEAAMEMRKLEIGMVVVFVDTHRVEQNALVVAIHGDPHGGACKSRLVDADGNDIPEGVTVSSEKGHRYVSELVPGTEGKSWPCINLVIVSPNQECQDQYGRQLERHCSVVHMSNSSAMGYCFHFVDEKLDPRLRQPTVS